MLNALDLVACQFPDHAARFVALGAPRDRVHVLGNVKFDVVVPDGIVSKAQRLRTEWGIADRPVWIAASTHAGEEAIVFAAHRALSARFPRPLVIVAPRHPARFDSVVKLAVETGLETVRLSAEVPAVARADVLIGDVMGRLLELYALADVAFVGGSLVPHGGHNPIEPAALGLPIVMGVHDFNFADVTALFEREGCLRRASDAGTLTDQLARLFSDPQLRAAEGGFARRVVSDNRGATERQWRKLVEVTPALRGG
jgi:3-deoxy-D-manno-octulosonic-acid transferase